MPPTCPKYRFTAVANGQQRSVAVDPELRQRPSMGGQTELPKLAVASTLAGCRAASGGLPARTEVALDGPHPLVELEPLSPWGSHRRSRCHAAYVPQEDMLRVCDVSA